MNRDDMDIIMRSDDRYTSWEHVRAISRNTALLNGMIHPPTQGRSPGHGVARGLLQKIYRAHVARVFPNLDVCVFYRDSARPEYPRLDYGERDARIKRVLDALFADALEEYKVKAVELWGITP